MWSVLKDVAAVCLTSPRIQLWNDFERIQRCIKSNGSQKTPTVQLKIATCPGKEVRGRKWHVSRHNLNHTAVLLGGSGVEHGFVYRNLQVQIPHWGRTYVMWRRCYRNLSVWRASLHQNKNIRYNSSFNSLVFILKITETFAAWTCHNPPPKKTSET